MMYKGAYRGIVIELRVMSWRHVAGGFRPTVGGCGLKGVLSRLSGHLYAISAASNSENFVAFSERKGPKQHSTLN